VRGYLRQRGIRPVIPTRTNQRPHPHFDRATYRHGTSPRSFDSRYFGPLAITSVLERIRRI
jgi:hypothetical protein